MDLKTKLLLSILLAMGVLVIVFLVLLLKQNFRLKVFKERVEKRFGKQWDLELDKFVFSPSESFDQDQRSIVKLFNFLFMQKDERKLKLLIKTVIEDFGQPLHWLVRAADLEPEIKNRLLIELKSELEARVTHARIRYESSKFRYAQASKAYEARPDDYVPLYSEPSDSTGGVFGPLWSERERCRERMEEAEKALSKAEATLKFYSQGG